MVDEAGGGGLAVRAGDANHCRRGIAPSELNLADDGYAGGLRLLYHRRGVGNAGALDNLVSVEDEALGVSALLPADAPVVEHLLIAQRNLSHVAHEHVEALFLGQHGGACTALAGSENDDASIHARSERR